MQLALTLGLLNANFMPTRAKWSSFTIISGVCFLFRDS